MTLAQELDKAVLNGMNPEVTISIPVNLDRINRHIEITKNRMILIGGEPTAGKCLGWNTGIIMFNGTIKQVQDIVVGDILMGPDSKPRAVLSTTSGTDQMYWVRQKRGIDYKVNSQHILCFKKNRKEIVKRYVLPDQLHLEKKDRKRQYTLSDSKVEKYTQEKAEVVYNKPKTFFKNWKGYKVGVEFQSQYVEIDPYILGVWLGDGTSTKAQVTNIDPEILARVYQFAEENDLRVVQSPSNTITYDFTSTTTDGKRRPGTNMFYNFLKEKNLKGNKHIPPNYLYNNRQIRLQVLAGLIDTDGGLDKKGDSYSITQKNKRLAKEINYLAASLGFYSSITPKIAKMKREDDSVYECEVYKVYISGEDFSEIPCLVERKKAFVSDRRCNPLITPVKIEKAEIESYYGFEITGDGLFLLEDFTVTHNTTICQTTFITDPIEWYLKNKPKGMKLSVICFLMERKMVEYTAKWVAKKIFEDHGDTIPSKRILGRDNDRKLTKAEYDLVSRYYSMLNEWEADGLLLTSQGSKNPSGISMYLEAFAKKYGKIHKKDRTDKSMENILAADIYEPDHPNHIVLVIGDNASVLDGEQDLTQKGLVDKFNRTMMNARDVYGFSPVLVQHLGRDISSTARLKLGDLVPKLSDFADSSQTQKAADVVLALLNPTSHITKESGANYLGYDLNKLRDEEGLSYFRSLHILKNNFGAENISYPLGMHPTYGILRILPRLKQGDEVPDEAYQRITSGHYFLDKSPYRI